MILIIKNTYRVLPLTLPTELRAMNIGPILIDPRSRISAGGICRERGGERREAVIEEKGKGGFGICDWGESRLADVRGRRGKRLELPPKEGDRYPRELLISKLSINRMYKVTKQVTHLVTRLTKFQPKGHEGRYMRSTCLCMHPVMY